MTRTEKQIDKVMREQPRQTTRKVIDPLVVITRPHQAELADTPPVRLIDVKGKTTEILLDVADTLLTATKAVLGRTTQRLAKQQLAVKLRIKAKIVNFLIPIPMCVTKAKTSFIRWTPTALFIFVLIAVGITPPARTRKSVLRPITRTTTELRTRIIRTGQPIDLTRCHRTTGIGSSTISSSISRTGFEQMTKISTALHSTDRMADPSKQSATPAGQTPIAG